MSSPGKKGKRRGEALIPPVFSDLRKKENLSPLSPAPFLSAVQPPLALFVPSLPHVLMASWGHTARTLLPWGEDTQSHRREPTGPQLRSPGTLKEETLARGCVIKLSVTVLRLCLGRASTPWHLPARPPLGGGEPAVFFGAEELLPCCAASPEVGAAALPCPSLLNLIKSFHFADEKHVR